MTTDQIKRLLEFDLRKSDEAEAALHGALATARGEVGRIERAIVAQAKESTSIRAAIASLPKSPVTMSVELFDLDDPDPKKRAVARAVWRTQ